MIVYHGILRRLSENGYSTYRLEKDKIMSMATIDRIRHNKPITTKTLDEICGICKCQPGELLSWEPDSDEERE